MYSIETKGLSYRYAGGATLLNNINLQVPVNSIYGFLGANGAGKTTTIRILLGLLKKQEGEVNFFGKPFNKNRIEILKNTGSLVETPSIYNHLTAVENLLVLQKVYRFPTTRIAEVLDVVGLSGTGTKKAGKFSLGMKQRLGIAMAMVHNPKLLILDEPTNGLDPGGMVEVRELLKKLNRENGMTIVISSHLLSEIEKLVTHTGIISGGQLLFQGTLQELINKQTSASEVIIASSMPAQCLQLVSQFDGQAKMDGDTVVFRYTDKEKVAEVVKQLVYGDIDVYGVTLGGGNLESVFMSLTK
jgi:ABC-type multidrug transport system ATPase subunit